MNGVNSVVRSLTGPRRLRSVLRQKTAAINRLMVALDGPGELRAQIPASVFGGDIFGIMSRHLREALTIQPPPNPATSIPHRSRALPLPTDPLAQHSEDPFPLNLGLKPSTLQSKPVETVPTNTTLALLTEDHTPSSRNLETFTQPQNSRLRSSEGAFPASAVEALASFPNTTETRYSVPRSHSHSEPALVNSLRRYWQISDQKRDHLNPVPLPTASLNNPIAAAPLQPDQQTDRRAWPAFVGRDVSDKLRSFTSEPRPVFKSAPVTSRPDSQVQNVFNISVSNANQHAPDYDDLGERIAQILHEQALQHGIDVT